jgi:hypothetical protein
MTNYHLQAPDTTQPYSRWQEKKEKRQKVLEEVRHRRAEQYKLFLSKIRLANKQAA